MPLGGRSSGKTRLVMGLVMAVIALVSFFGSKVYNPVTGEDQYISITPNQEIALGLQALPQMVQQHGGHHPNSELQARVDRVGFSLVQNSIAAETEWDFEFHLLADEQTINAFALPGGQVFITAALFNRLQSEGQLAGVLGHEIGHVVARHSAQRIAKSELTQGLVGAVAVAATDPDNPRAGAAAAQVAAVVGQLVNMKYGREDELQSDQLGVKIMAQAGYDPRALIGVMQILAEAGGGGGQPEFFSTHPNPENRINQIQQAIQAEFPNGVPEGLIP
jgi:predicted Zn-dependent protease